MTVGVVALAVVSRWILAPLLMDGAPFATFTLAVIFCTWYAGLRSAALATVLGFFAALVFFVPPYSLAFDTSVPSLSRHAMYFIVNFSIAAFGEAMRNARAHLEDSRQLAQSRAEALRITLASIGDAVITTDGNGTITFLNTVAEGLTGWSNTTACGKPLNTVFNVINEETGQTIENPVTRILRGDSVPHVKNPLLVTRQGTRIPIDDSAAPILDEHGSRRGAILVFRDLTERRQAELEIQRGNQLARSILESITDAFFAVDDAWRFTYVNPQAVRLLNRQPGELLGRTLWETFPGLINSQFELAYRRVATERIKQSVTAFYPDHDRWYEVDAYPAATGLSIYFQDVSDRMRAAAEMERLTQVSDQQRRIYETALSNTADFNYIFDLQGRFVYVNEPLLELWNTTLPDALGKTFAELNYPPSLSDRLQRQIQSAIETRAPVRGEAPYTTGTGERQYEHIFVPVLESNGTVEAVAGSTRDITERKQAEEALRESEKRFRQLADAMPQIVWTAQPDGNIDYQNRKWQEFTGQYDNLSNDSWTPIVHPDDMPSARQRWDHSVQTGAPFEMEMRLFDRQVQAYRWYLIRTVAALNESGAVSRWFGTGTDIHEQKRTGETSQFLAEGSALLSGIVDYEETLQKVANLAVPYFADFSAVDLTSDGGSRRRLAIADRNPEKVCLAKGFLEQSTADSSGRDSGACHLGLPEIITDVSEEIMSQGMLDDRVTQLIRLLGLKSFISVPMISSGHPLGTLTFATSESGRRYTETDLTLAKDLAHRAAVAIENTRLYQALRDADRRKDEFLATLAHELRNPLAPIRNSLQILKLSRVDAVTMNQIMDMMERQVHHLVRLVDDLLDVSRVMRGKIELRREPIQLSTIVTRAVETAQPLIEAQGHHLEISLPDDSMMLDADPVRIAQVIGNLLTNAAKYTEPQGQIWLSAERINGDSVLTVRDDGIGIAPEMLNQVFELFMQVDHTAKLSQGGLGIGLTLVRNLVELHGGRVEAFSQGLGTGSEFVVHLPLLDTEPEQSTRTQEEQTNRRVTSGHRLLVVDDNKDAAVSLAILLRLQGHDVQVAHDGRSALNLATEFQPRIVFLDIGMPGMDGYEVARQMRQIPELKSATLAALTGWGQHEDRRRTTEAGFDHHLVKPPDPRALEFVLSELAVSPPAVVVVD